MRPLICFAHGKSLRIDDCYIFVNLVFYDAKKADPFRPARMRFFLLYYSFEIVAADTPMRAPIRTPSALRVTTI